MPRLRIALNGTNVNPFEKMGLPYNPIPQLGQNQYDAACLALQSLAGPPIPHDHANEYIRNILAPHCSEDLIRLCVEQFVPGQIVRFAIRWPD